MRTNPYDELGAGFKGVGSSGYDQNQGTTDSSTDFDKLLAQILAGGTNTASNTDVVKFRAGLLNNDATAIRLRQLMIQNGIISASAKLDTVVSAYEDVLGDLASFKSIGQVFTIEQMIQRLGAFNSALPGSGGTGKTGPSSSVTEVDYGKADVGDKSQGARQARKQIQEYFREVIGRPGTAEEVEEMRVALVKAAGRAKPVTTTVREGNRTVTRVTPGFDIKSWATGYISTKFADEDVEGVLGEAQDRLKALARAYGVDMGESWYAAATKQVGKGTAVEDFLDEIKQTAIGRYPGLADRINKGSNVAQIASPYIQSKARILEIDPDSVDLDDMDIQQALGYKDEKGAYSTKPLWQYETDLRRKPEWQYTKNAKDSYDTLMLKVLRDFGLMG
jgi:hypothetical protein